jgi:predicted nucleotidyltransferase
LPLVVAPEDVEIARSFIGSLAARLGDRLQTALLFGSRARGEADPDSDFDVLVLVDRGDASVREAVADAAEPLFPAFLDVHVFTPERWAWSESADAPLLRHARAEGIVLWPRQSSARS